MTGLITSRRRFLIGAAAAIAAVAGARVLKQPPKLAPLSPGRRHAYPFSVHGVGRQRVIVRSVGRVEFAQVEAGPIATSYIPTGATPVTREADTIRLASDFTKEDWFFRDSAATMEDADGRPRLVPPDQPRVIPGKGLLVEPQATNLLLFSDECSWDQELWLEPGDYVASWYGEGHIRLIGEAIALVRGPIDRIEFSGTRTLTHNAQSLMLMKTGFQIV